MSDPLPVLNQPIGRIPWLLAAAPGTSLFRVLVDVEDPVAWDIGAAGSQQGRVTEPLCSPFPVITTRGNVNGFTGTFTLFIPDGPDRDRVVDSIIAARIDPKIPYFIWKALDGAEAWAVQFDPQQKITVGYIQGHRVVKVTFVQMGRQLDLTAPVVTIEPPPRLRPPAMIVTQTDVYRGESVYIAWNHIVGGDLADYIGVFLPSVTDNEYTSAMSYVRLAGTTEGNAYIGISPYATPDQYEFRMVNHAVPSVTLGPKIQVHQASMSVDIVVNPIGSPDPFESYDITYNWADFYASDPPVKIGMAPYGVWSYLTGVPVDVSGLAGTATIHSIEAWIGAALPAAGTINAIVPVMQLQSGRIVIGPLN